MNDISYKNSMSDQAICNTIGNFIKHMRLKRNSSQDAVAEAANISRSTLSLMERGKPVNLLNLIQVLRVLDALHIMDAFQVITSPSPLALAKLDREKRERASSKI